MTHQPIDVPRQDADGIPHISYYIPGENLGFVWSGHRDDPIQAGREPGEPILWQFHFYQPHGMNTLQTMGRFQQACDAFVETRGSSDLDTCTYCHMTVAIYHPTLTGGPFSIGEPPRGGQFGTCPNPTGQGHVARRNV